ncbi:hypothetical protein AZH53_06155 [Methanomicrobiaceae archaeon CYW5]|uniref:hypothetical protein n=1 Tax=Methanovulcanius yangii TaxID=1789227 RepID=UPI0029CA8A6C|nr:hypothetical protein [Methanovulcanius yangii]MBT8507991.1 hypothetical protein [Methanovulcanius yangii]
MTLTESITSKLAGGNAPKKRREPTNEEIVAALKKSGIDVDRCIEERAKEEQRAQAQIERQERKEAERVAKRAAHLARAGRMFKDRDLVIDIIGDKGFKRLPQKAELPKIKCPHCGTEYMQAEERIVGLMEEFAYLQTLGGQPCGPEYYRGEGLHTFGAHAFPGMFARVGCQCGNPYHIRIQMLFPPSREV